MPGMPRDAGSHTLGSGCWQLLGGGVGSAAREELGHADGDVRVSVEDVLFLLPNVLSVPMPAQSLR